METRPDAVSHLLVCLVEAEELPLTSQAAYVREMMTEAGFSEVEAVRAFADAKANGYTDTDDLGRDRLTVSGRTRGLRLQAEVRPLT